MKIIKKLLVVICICLLLTPVLTTGISDASTTSYFDDLYDN
ncbi:MAG: hypothetical protein SPJ65_09780 [Roseburia sp.]|nr:hypothetical protein [Roseburia sp.]